MEIQQAVKNFSPDSFVDAFINLSTSPYFWVGVGLVGGYIVLNSKAVANLFKRR